MAQPEPADPSPQRPWYYQNWFLVAAFILGWPVVTPPFGILWPTWGLLILRSPWHNHPLLKGLGWAMLVVGGVMFVRALAVGGNSTGIAIMTLIPGLLAMLATQVMWARYKLENKLENNPGGAPTPTPVTPPLDSQDAPQPSRRSRPRRRVHRRRGSGSGRASQ